MKHLCTSIIEQPEEKVALGSSSNRLGSVDPKIYVTWNSGRTKEVVRANSIANPRIWLNWCLFKGTQWLWCFLGWPFGPAMKWNPLHPPEFFLWPWSLGGYADTLQPYNNFFSPLSFSFLPPCFSPSLLLSLTHPEFIYFWNPMWAHCLIENLLVWRCVILKRI